MTEDRSLVNELPCELIVTTSINSQRAHDDKLTDAMRKAEYLGCRFVGREWLKAEIEALAKVNVLVFMEGAVRLTRFEGGKKKESLRFHPSTSLLRIASIKSGHGDVMADALQIEPGCRILDCTMGLGSDSITAAWAAGPNGSVTSLEASWPMFLAIDIGMNAYTGSDDVVRAIGRVMRINTSYREFLKGCPDSAYDAVYMDPMFHCPVAGSPIDALRTWAVTGTPSEEDITEALRVTRSRLVIKLRKGDDAVLLSKLPGFTVFHSSKSGSVKYVGFSKGARNGR